MIDYISFNFFGEDAVFHHAGIAVDSINNVLNNLITIKDEKQNVNVSFIKINGFNIELIEPDNDYSPVSAIIKNGQSLYHLCFEVSDINDAIDIAKKNKFRCIVKPVPAKAFNNKNIAWVFNMQFGLFELLER